MSGIQPARPEGIRVATPGDSKAPRQALTRPWPWWLCGALRAFVLALFLAMACCVVGPDPRYLLVRKGMTEAQVQALLGQPTYYDRTENDDPAWRYAYDFTVIIVEWDAQGRVSKTQFLW